MNSSNRAGARRPVRRPVTVGVVNQCAAASLSFFLPSTFSESGEIDAGSPSLSIAPNRVSKALSRLGAKPLFLN